MLEHIWRALCAPAHRHPLHPVPPHTLNCVWVQFTFPQFLENFPRTADRLGTLLFMAAEARGHLIPRGPSNQQRVGLSTEEAIHQLSHVPVAASDNGQMQRRHVSLGTVRTNTCYCDWLLMLFWSMSKCGRATSESRFMSEIKQQNTFSAEQGPLCSNLFLWKCAGNNVCLLQNDEVLCWRLGNEGLWVEAFGKESDP